MTEFNKFRVRGLSHFHKSILPSYDTEFPFQKLHYVYKGTNYCITKIDWYTDTKCDDKEFMQFQ